jgi:RHS repeat-associated protein
MRKTTGLHWMFGDHLGSASTVRTPAGTNVRQRYLPFGRVRGAASLPTEYGFTGQRLDPSGLMDYNARQYDPVLGRFTSPDTIIPDAADPQSFNRYSYVNNNPVNFTDPTGHCSTSAGKEFYFGDCIGGSAYVTSQNVIVELEALSTQLEEVYGADVRLSSVENRDYVVANGGGDALNNFDMAWAAITEEGEGLFQADTSEPASITLGLDATVCAVFCMSLRTLEDGSFDFGWGGGFAVGASGSVSYPAASVSDQGVQTLTASLGPGGSSSWLKDGSWSGYSIGVSPGRASALFGVHVTDWGTPKFERPSLASSKGAS